METRLSIIVATAGREMLSRALRSARVQMHAADELIVATHSAEAASVAADMGAVVVPCDRGGDWGYRERQRGMTQARGSYVTFLDDDDVLLSDALDTMRAAITAYPGRPLMFRMIAPWGEMIWRNQNMQTGNVSGAMFVAPNDRRLGTWGTRYEGDFDFIASTLANYEAGSLVWIPAVTYVCRPRMQESQCA